jgi:hypothetical protein
MTITLTLPVLLALAVLLVVLSVGCYTLGFHEGRQEGRSSAEDERGGWRW